MCNSVASTDYGTPVHRQHFDPVDGLRTAGVHVPQCRFQFSTGSNSVQTTAYLSINTTPYTLHVQQA